MYLYVGHKAVVEGRYKLTSSVRNIVPKSIVYGTNIRREKMLKIK
jgi:hypothetical protein